LPINAKYETVRDLPTFRDAAQDTRAAMFIMLGTIIITSAIWQAVALALARFENLILPRLRD
jgi:hypothetical protein